MSELILIIEDERDLVQTLEYNLQREGFRTLAATTGARGLELATGSPSPDLILLDLMLPDISGLDVCRKVREADATKAIPVLMLTARGEEIDRVVGFEIGADDYVTKPFSVRELVLRVRAVLRRGKQREPLSEEVVFGVLRLSETSHRAWVGPTEIELTALEFRLLARLLARRGRVQSRELLLEDVWGIHSEVTTRTVDTHVKRLRQKLGEAGTYIETLRGVGYRFRAAPDEE